VSKSTIGGVIGAVIGFYVSGFNPYGAQVGFMIGAGIGASFDTIQGRKVGEMSSPRAQEGEPIPLVFGTARVTGRLMSCGEPSIVEEGGKGGPKVVNETAYLSYSILVCESSELRDSSIAGIVMVIENNKIVYDVRPNPAISAADSAKWKQNKVFYFGGEGQGVDPTEQMIHGVGNVPAYRGLCRMVVTDEDVTQHGGGIPTYAFVTTGCGTVGEVPPSSARFLSFGQAASGFRGVSRPLDSSIEWIFASDADVYSIDDTIPYGCAVYGSRVFSATLGGECAFAEIAALDTWAAGPTGLPLIVTGGAMAAVGTRLWYAASSSGMKYLDDPTDAAFQTIATFSGAQMSAVVGIGNNVLAASYLAKIYVAAGGSTTFSLVNDLYLPAGMQIQADCMAASDTRLLVAGFRYAPSVQYSDNLGASFTAGTFPATAGIPACARYCGGTRWLVGCSYGSSTTGLYMSTDNGASFAAVTLPETININEFGIAIDGETGACVVHGTTAASSPRAYWTADYATWNVLSLAGTETGDTVFPLFPVGSDGFYSPPEGAIELPDAEGYYVDPVTGDTSGPTYEAPECPGVTLQEIIDKLDARAGIPTANRDSDAVADIVVPGYAIDSFMTVAEAKEPLRQIYRVACPEYDDKIRYRLYGLATDFTVDPDDLILTDEATEKGVRGQTVEFPKRLHVQYVDPAPGYKPMKQTAERISPDIRVKGELVSGANITLEADTAKQAADIGLKVAWTEREDSREFALPIDYFAETIPAHTFTLDGRRYRITDMRLDAGAVHIKSVYDRISAYQSNAVGTVGPSPTPPPSNVRGPTISMVMNAPVLRDADDKAGIYWAGCGPMEGWQGARLQVSRDNGATWENGPLITAPAVMGELTATLPAASRYAQDNTNTLAVTMYRDEASMDSTDFAGLMEERNVWAIQYPDGTVEIGQHEIAIETAPRQWELTGLMRGRQDTVAGEHLVGAKFVLLTDNVRFVAIRPDDVGKTLEFRAVSTGTDPDAAEVQAVTFTTIESLREWQPYNIEVTADGLGGYCVSCIARARLGSSRTPIHSQWYEGLRYTFTIGSTVHEVDTTAQAICVSAATMLEVFGPGHGLPTITVRARSRVATNDDDFDSTPGIPTTDPNPSYPATIIGEPGDMYEGEGVLDYLGPDNNPPFQAYGGKTEEYFTGYITRNVTCQSSAPGSGIMVGIPLTAGTAAADAELVPSGPDVVGGPFTITDSVTVQAMPAYAVMDELNPWGGKKLATLVTATPRTTKRIGSSGLGGLRSRAGFSTGECRCEFTIDDLPAGGRIAIGALAAGVDAHLAPGTGGSFAYTVTADGTFAVELDAATGAVEVYELGVGLVASGTLPLTYAHDGKYRFAWVANDAQHPAAGATVHTNQGNESWAITPTGTFGGVPNEANVIPCGWDAAVAAANGYRPQGTQSLTLATTGGFSGTSVVYAYSEFAKSSGQWRIGMAGATNGVSRIGLCKASHTGLLGQGGDSFGMSYDFAVIGSPQLVFDTTWAGQIRIPHPFYAMDRKIIFVCDFDAHTVEVWGKPQFSDYILLTVLTGLPSGSWVPAGNHAVELINGASEIPGATDWSVTKTP
jgi:hypothetical protein